MVVGLASKKTWFSAKQQDNFWLQIFHYLGESSVNNLDGLKNSGLDLVAFLKPFLHLIENYYFLRRAKKRLDTTFD
jgi:hypothetical protein